MEARLVLSPPCLASPLMIHSHLQVMKHGPGLALLGFSFPICKLGFLHAYLAGGIHCKALRSLFLLLAATGPGWEEEPPSWGLC